MAKHLARSFAGAARSARWALSSAELARKILGAPRMYRWSLKLHQRFTELPVYLAEPRKRLSLLKLSTPAPPQPISHVWCILPHASRK